MWGVGRIRSSLGQSAPRRTSVGLPGGRASAPPAALVTFGYSAASARSPHRERLGAGPGMLGNIEQDAFGAIKLDLEAADPLGVGSGPCNACRRGSRAFSRPSRHPRPARRNDAARYSPCPSELVGLEPQDRQIDRAVAQMVAISQRAVVRAHDLEVKRLYIEIRHRVGVFRGDGDVAQFGHDPSLV